MSPAGDPEALKAAVNSGADAVYLGAKQFSARGRAVNFTEDEIAEAIDYSHLRGVEVYIAINILYKNAEIRQVVELVRDLAQLGADAFIVQDIGLARVIHGMWPEIKLHASTQMTALTPDDVRFLKQAGFSRAILGRELSLERIKEIASLKIMETEVFIHGALCVCYSGQCLMSSKIGGRSGNRGQCAQPCRLPYTLTENGKGIADGYLLSPRDLTAVGVLPEIISAGVDCLKIEGRMKDAVYTAAVTAEYRRLLDGGKPDLDSEKRLKQVFNRGGDSIPGYFFQHAGRDMMSLETPKNTGILAGVTVGYDARREACAIKAHEPFSPGDGLEIWTQTVPHCGAGVNRSVRAGETFTIKVKGNIRAGDPVYKTFDKALDDSVKNGMKRDTRKLAVTGRFTAKSGQRLKLELSYKDMTTTVYADAPQPAKTSETGADEIIERLSKTGSGTLRISWESIEADKRMFIAASVLNNLRREAASQMESAILNKSRAKLELTELPVIHQAEASGVKRIHVSITRPYQLAAALSGGADRVIMEQPAIDPAVNLLDICHAHGAELFLALPLGDMAGQHKLMPADGYYARSWGHLQVLHGAGRVIADYSVQAFNKYSIDYVTRFCEGVTLSPEMDLMEARENASAGCELIVYGRLPLMVTRQCPIGNFEAAERGAGGFGCSCDKRLSYALADRKGYVFPVEPDCQNCRASIMNAVPADLSKKAGELRSIPCDAYRIMLFDESVDEVTRIVAIWKNLI